MLAEYFICIICKTDYYYLTPLLMDEKEMKAQYVMRSVNKGAGHMSRKIILHFGLIILIML